MLRERLSFLRSLLWTDPLLLLTTAVMGSISMGVSLFDSTGFRQHKVAQIWARMLCRIAGVKIRADGLEHIQAGQGYVFAGNHVSYMDIPVLMGTLNVQLRFLAKASLFRIPFLGHHLRRSGHFPVVRGDAKASLKCMTDAAEAIRRLQVSVIIFPEGSRSWDGELQEFQEGAAYVAIKAGVPVVPFAIEGMHRVLPRGSIHVRGNQVTLRVGAPIPTSGLTLKHRAELTARLREEIRALMELASGSPGRDDGAGGAAGGGPVHAAGTSLVRGRAS